MATATKVAQPSATAKALAVALAPDPIETMVGDALRTTRARKDTARAGRTRDHLYVSEVGTVMGESACWRKLWYAYHNAPQDPLPDDTLLNFEIGDVVGLRIANILASSGAVEKVELHMDFPGLPVTGRLDVLLSTDKRVVEVKTATLKQRAYLPKPEHLLQCLLCVHGVRLMPEYANVTGGVVLYVFKDPAKGQPVKAAYAVPYEQDRANEALAWFRAAHKAASAERMPKRPVKFTQSRFPCAYCSFKTHCWSGREVLQLSSAGAEPVPF